MRATVGQPNIAVTPPGGRHNGLFQCRGALSQLLRFLQQQIAAAVDADILQLIRIAPKPPSLLRVPCPFRLLRQVVIDQ
jgi:hypothetical protein